MENFRHLSGSVKANGVQRRYKTFLNETCFHYRPKKKDPKGL